MKADFACLVLVCSLLSACSPAQRLQTLDAEHTGGAAQARGAAIQVKRELLEQRALPDLPGWESRLYLIEFPPGAEAKLHAHPVPCVGYVLEGSFESAFEGEAPQIKRAGQSFIDQAGKSHRFRNLDAQRPLRFLVAGTFPHGAPLFEPR